MPSMMLWKGPLICSPNVAFVVEHPYPRGAQSEAAMLLDVGQRLLCSLRNVDPRRRSFSCNPPPGCCLAAHFSTRRLDVVISSRYCWHGSQKVVSDDKLVKLVGAFLRFGAALRSWRSWVLASGRLADRCSLHRFVVSASTEAEGVINNDQLTHAQAEEDKQSLLEAAKICTEKSLLYKLETTNQLESVNFLVVDALKQLDDSTNENGSPKKIHVADVGPSYMGNVSSSKVELITNAVVIVFDIETTGFKVSDDRIVEFAARDLAGGECSTLQTLVNPDRPIPLRVTNVHGINSDMVNKSDIPRWKDVAPILIQFVESRRRSGGPVLLVAHNGRRFDVPFLVNEFQRCSVQIPLWWQFVDSVPIAREAMKAKGLKGLPLRLSALHEYYNLPFAGQAHRALADVHMLASVLQMLMTDLKMPVSVLLERSFTAKDIWRSSTPISVNNLESYSQDIDLTSELLIEGEDSTEGLCAPTCEVDEDSLLPWENNQTEQMSLGCEESSSLEGKVLQEEDPEESVCFSGTSHVEEKTETQTSPIDERLLSAQKNRCHTSSENDNIDGSSFEGVNHSPSLDSGCSYRVMDPTLKSDNGDFCQLAPMLKQYMQTKLQRPKLLLLWNVGDFYQAFFEDAEKLAEVCNVALAEIKGAELLDGLVPMASLHNAQVDGCIQALLGQGISVLRQDQVSRMEGDKIPSQECKNMILTPGTPSLVRRLEGCANSYLLAIVPSSNEDGIWGLAYADISTGEFCATEAQGKRSIVEEVLLLQPSEIIYSANADSESTQLHLSGMPPGFCYCCRPSSEFHTEAAIKKLQESFGVDVLERFGLEGLPVATRAAGGLLGFIEEIQQTSGVKLPFHKISPYFVHDYLHMDQCSRIFLEVFRSKKQSRSEGSLLWAIDHTKTAMGKRMLRKWLSRPLLDKELICTRLGAVEVFVNDPELRAKVRYDLSSMNDLERLAGEIVSDRGTPWDLLAMGQSLNILPSLLSKLKGLLNPYFLALACDKKLLELGQKIQSLMRMEACSFMQDIQIIKDNVDDTLDALRGQIQSVDLSIKNYEKFEQDRLGIPSLKVVKNEVGDHFITVKKHELINIPFPVDYQLHSTSGDSECFVTSSLLKDSRKRCEVVTKARLHEAKILNSLKQEVYCLLEQIRTTCKAVAAVDVLAAFAELSVLREYCKPVIIEDSREITVKEGRHPVAELLCPERRHFNPNSLYMGYQSEESQQRQHKWELHCYLNKSKVFLPEECWPRPDVLILTGPPASGKSCYLRQVALIQILAQIGSYVPAEEAKLGIADAIYVKMDAADDLFTGLSSFELDMMECANILKNATSQSLILLDGVARSTSSHEGDAITRAIIEFLAQNIRARTLFTTQSGNLCHLEEEFPNISIFHCRDNVDSKFPHCVKPGFFTQLSAVAVSKVAGIPEWVSCRAAQLISQDDTIGVEALQIEQSSLEEDSSKMGYCLSDVQLEKTILLSNQIKGIDAILPSPAPIVEDVFKVGAETHQDLKTQDSAHLKTLENVWQNMLQVLQEYPATHALTKQKGALVSVQKSLEVSHVHMSTSALFIKKFLQHEHATALENSFLTVLQTPIQLKITIAMEERQR